jgi:hypothetical protein
VENQERATVLKHREEIAIQGRLREAVEAPVLGLSTKVSWTDERSFRATVVCQRSGRHRWGTTGCDTLDKNSAS